MPERLAEREQRDNDDDDVDAVEQGSDANVSRGRPVCESMPISPMVTPTSRLAAPLSRLWPSSALTVTNARAMSATYSGGPKLVAKSATGARETSAR